MVNSKSTDIELADSPFDSFFNGVQRLQFKAMQIEEIHQANRAGWNQGAEAYEADLKERIDFLRAGGTNFCPPEYAFLSGLKDWCGRAIHLQCAGGTDTLSLWNLGAGEVVGVDISEGMLAVARQKSDALGAPATWVHSDVLSTPASLDGTADLVYTGRGALCWLMDLSAWARVVARLLKPGGRLYVFEGHPVSNLFKLESDHFELDPEYGDYFKKDPIADAGWPSTYIGDLGKAKAEHAVKYERLWTLGDVVNSVIDAGLVLERLEEHPDSFWPSHPNIAPELLRRVPQTFSLLASRKS
jgi:SAM-dependent methyltransferase